MRWRRRLCRSAKSACALFAWLVAAIWAASTIGWLQWLETGSGNYLIAGTGRGFVVTDWCDANARASQIAWIPHNFHGGLTRGWFSDSQPLQAEWWWLPRVRQPSPSRHGLVILPLWLPFSLCLGAWVLLRRRDHKHSLDGWCFRCDYDCRGLPPGSPCPECGHEPLRGRRLTPSTTT